jgi:hypothetical protein
MITTPITAKERPILFGGAMVRALLAGTKTLTRRVVKLNNGRVVNPFFKDEGKGEIHLNSANGEVCEAVLCPYGKVGDRLWVRETWLSAEADGQYYVKYAADYGEAEAAVMGSCCGGWKASIHMPRAACRILLEVASVRVERLQDISEADAVAEGVEQLESGAWRDYRYADLVQQTAKASFNTLWQSIKGFDSWAANPWVWVAEFNRINPVE